MNIEALKKIGKLRVYKKGDVICKEKESSQYVYLLLRGKADIFKKIGEEWPGKPILKVQEGTIFGEMSLIGGNNSSSIVVGKDNTIVFELEKNKYKKLLKEDTEIAYMLLRTLITRINALMDRLIVRDPAFIFQMRNNDIYNVVNTMELTMYHDIVSCNKEYPLTVLVELNKMFEELSERMLS